MSRRKQIQPRHFDTEPGKEERDEGTRNTEHTRSCDRTNPEESSADNTCNCTRTGVVLPKELPGSESQADYSTPDTEIIKEPSATNPGIGEKDELPPTKQTPLEYHKKLYLGTKGAETAPSPRATASDDLLNTFHEHLPTMEVSERRRTEENHPMDQGMDDCQVGTVANKEVRQSREEEMLYKQTDRDLNEDNEECDANGRLEEESLHSENSIDMLKSLEGHCVEDDELVRERVKEGDACLEDDSFGSLGTVNNVKLESLKNTSVAVAQIVENNLPSAHMVPSLMQTVYGLWQQQMMQCHMLEAVRQHLVKIAKDKNIPLPSLPINGMAEDLAAHGADHGGGLGLAYRRNSVRGSPVSPALSDLEDGMEEIAEEENGHPSTAVSANGGKFPVHSSGEHVRKPSTMGVTSPSTAAEVPSQFVRSAGNKLDVGTALDRSQYAADDPLFRHKCRFCDKIFGSDSALQIHVRSHTGERPYECDVCNSRFSTRGNLKVHYEGHLLDPYQPHTNRPSEGGAISRAVVQMKTPQHHTKPSLSFPYTASVPSTFTSPPAADTASIKTEAGETARDKARVPLFSPTSDLTANLHARHHFSLMSSTSPMMGHVPPTSFPGTMMSSSFTSPPLGTGTIASMSGMMPPMSPFMKPSILPQQNEDDELEQYMEETKSETSKLEAMVKNIENKITDPNQCVICKRILSCKSALQMHYRIHTGERPFRCKICGRTFTTKGNLKTHMGVHRLKPAVRAMHQCPVCQKQFTNPIVLQQHIQSYHTDMPQLLRPGFPGMMPPNSMMLFGGLQPTMLPQHLMDRMSPFSSVSGMNGADHSDYGRSADNELSDCDDFDVQSELSTSEANFSDMVKRPRMVDEESTSAEPLSEMKRPKMELLEHEDVTDDEEVPREVENDSSIPKADDTSYDRPLLPRSNSSTPFPPSCMDSKLDSSISTSTISVMEDRMKQMTNAMCSQKNYLTDEIHRKLEVGSRGQFSYGSMAEEIDGPSNMTSPAGSSKSTSLSDRNTTRTTSPRTTPPLRSPFSPIGLNPHSLNFAATGRPGYYTTCDLCFKTFACKSALEIHYRSHTKEKPFRCGLCDRGFSTRGNLKQHYLTHKLRELQEAGIDTSRADDDHHEDVKSEPTTGPFNQPQMLPPHLPQHESNPSKVSPDKPEGGYHPSETKTQPSLQNTLSNASVHQPFSHLNSLPSPGYHPYSDQSRPVNPVQPLQREQHQMDNSDYMQCASLKHKCQVCHKPFSSSSALQIHMRTHTGERPFKCLECNKGFTTKGNLKVHMSTHEDRMNFTRRGRRMTMDGFPRFDGLPHPVGPPGFPNPNFLQPPMQPKSTPDLFMPRFPFMGLRGMNGFMAPRPSEMPVSQPLHLASPIGRPKFSQEETNEQSDTKHLREVSKAS